MLDTQKEVDMKMERFEDATLLALKMEEGVIMSQ